VEVFRHRHFWKYAATLWNTGHAGGDDLMGGRSSDITAEQRHRSGARGRQTEDHANQRALAGTVGAQDAGDSAFLDAQGNATQYVRLIVAGAYLR